MFLFYAGLACSDPAPPAPAEAPAATPLSSLPEAPPGMPKGVIGGEPILPKTVVVGDLSTQAVDNAMAANRPAFRGCYDKAEKKGAGKVLLRFSIAGNGRAFGITTRSTSLRSPEVETCLHQALDAVRFPEIPVGTAVVMYPFSFP